MRRVRASSVATLAISASLTLAALPAAAAELRGAAILEHPCGQTAVLHMALVHAGKMEEAVRLGTPAMQQKWSDLPAEDRDMMSEMMQAMLDCGLEVEAHHHEVASGGQCEIDLKYQPLVKMADWLQIYRFCS